MVRVCLLVHIYGASASGASRIKTLAFGIVDQVINALIDRKRLELFARLRVEDNDLSAAAARKQAMVGFIERQGDVGLTESDGPVCDDGASIPVNHHNLVRRWAADIQ